MLSPKISSFIKDILKRPLYPYQERIAVAIIDSVLRKKGLTFTVMLSRQMGKNELSAAVEAYLLTCMLSGTIVKAAPTFKPQVITSRRRLLNILENVTFDQRRVWKSFGYIIGVTHPEHPGNNQTGPNIMFFSADPDSNIVGATASLLLEVDEAQDVNIEKFNRDLRPMASTTNATTVLYGTAWTEDSLLAIVKATNQKLEEEDGMRRHFQYDWRTLAEINPDYKAFVEGEIQRLGEEHPTIRTQYQLLPISGAGYLLNELQRGLLGGEHKWLDEPDEDDYYVAGIDVGGEERTVETGLAALERKGKHNSGKRDSTVLTIGRVSYNEFDLPCLEVVHQYWFTGMIHSEQYAMVRAIVKKWHIRKLVVDATGVGEGLASLLLDRFSEKKIRAFKFSRSSKSTLTYQFLSMISSGRLRLYSPEGAPSEMYNECWKQLRLARYRVPGENLIDMYVPSEEGHDDFLISLALCSDEANKKKRSKGYVPAAMIRPEPLYPNEGWC